MHESAPFLITAKYLKTKTFIIHKDVSIKFLGKIIKFIYKNFLIIKNNFCNVCIFQNC